MAKDFIDHITQGLLAKTLFLSTVFSVCIFICLLMFSIFTLNTVFDDEYRRYDTYLTNLINQQRNSPGGLVAIYTLDADGGIINRRGGSQLTYIPEHSEVPIIKQIGDYLITVSSNIADYGRNVRVYSVEHGLYPPVESNISFTATSINMYRNVSSNAIPFSISVDITLHIIFTILGISIPFIVGYAMFIGSTSILTNQVNRDIIPSLIEIQDKVVDVTEGHFDAYLNNVSDVQIIKHIIDSFNQMFIAVSEEINKHINQANNTKADSESRGNFLANISHEIRTPLNSIYNLSRLIDEKTEHAELYQNLLDIREASKYLLTIVNDFLDLSKAGAEEMQLEETVFDIVEVFQSCQLMLQTKADEKGLNLMCHVEPEEGKVFKGDVTKLKQVFINLLSNSIKFTHKGEVTLTGKVHKRSSNGVTMRFIVKDTGIGMTATQLENIFTPYKQADVYTQRRYGGTGLGMTISRKIVELMGGVLEAESLEGVGTKFSFNVYFPTETSVVSDSPVKTRRIIQRDEPPWYGLTALVFEDNRTNQKIMERHLKAVGIETLLAEDGGPGLKLYSKHSNTIDVIFMDMNMIEMDGSEATQRLREMGAKQPIIMITAMTVNNFDSIYKPQGFTDNLDKTFDKEVLWQLLDKYFDEKPKTVKDQLMLKGDEDLLADALYDLDRAESELRQAYNDQNWHKTYKICHSIKGTSLVINATKLSTIAKELEERFKNNEDVELASVERLCAELTRVINRLTPKQTSMNKETKEILKKIQTLLRRDDFNVVKYAKTLQKMPDMEVLVTHLSNYDLTSALNEVELLMRKS